MRLTVVLPGESDAGEQPGGPVYRRQNGVVTRHLLLAGVLLLTGCSFGPTSPDVDIRLPPAGAGFGSAILRDLDLSTPLERDYVFARC
jgi:hypothetical protein